MGRLTRSKAIKNHREMWNKIVELLEESHKNGEGYNNITSYKERSLKELGYSYDEMPKNYCWACEYDCLPKFRNTHKCANCLFTWGDADYCCDSRSIYCLLIRRIQSKRYDEAAELAKQVANLPEVQD
jgi:hypothetical protein